METIKNLEEKKKVFTLHFSEDELNKINSTAERKTMYQIKEGPKTYPWPCEIDPKRTITITTDDLFTKTHDGTIIKHTGIGCFGIKIPNEDLIEIFD